MTYKDTNQYLPNKFSLYVAKDKWHATYSGQIGFLRFNAGEGAFSVEKYGDAKDDIFGYKLGKEHVLPASAEPVVDTLRE